MRLAGVPQERRDQPLGVAMTKGHDVYILRFDPDQAGEALRTLGRWASNPELSLSWPDVASLAHEIRRKVAVKPPSEEIKFEDWDGR